MKHALMAVMSNALSVTVLFFLLIAGTHQVQTKCTFDTSAATRVVTGTQREVSVVDSLESCEDICCDDIECQQFSYQITYGICTTWIQVDAQESSTEYVAGTKVSTSEPTGTVTARLIYLESLISDLQEQIDTLQGCDCNDEDTTSTGPDEQGEASEQGSPGAIGPPGPIGPAGAIGPTGALGPMGPPGEEGLSGPPGPIGPTGTPGTMGPAGEEGPPGLRGEVGLTGSTGPAGHIGLTGSTGQTGQTGPPGVSGQAGAPGTPGQTGQTGEPGISGQVGSLGSRGPPGPPGPSGSSAATYASFNYQSSWADYVLYGWGSGQVVIAADGQCTLSGLVKYTAGSQPPLGSSIFLLPNNCIPSREHTFLGFITDKVCRLDVRRTGQVQISTHQPTGASNFAEFLWMSYSFYP